MYARKDPSFSRFATAFLTSALLGALLGAGPAAYAQAPQSAGAPDSAAPGRDPFLAPPAAPVPDSGAAAQPPQEAVKLSTQGAFSAASARAGDSLDYVVQVKWEDTQVPVFVLAPDSLSFPGFRILGQATVHKKLASGQAVRNHTEFIYRLRAETQGTGKASSLKVRYFTGLSRQEEAVFIPTALLDIGPAPVRLLDMLWFKLLLGLFAIGAAAALAYGAFRITLRKRAAKIRIRADLKPEIAALRNRLRSALNSPDASKALLLEMEGLALRFLRDELASTLPVTASAAGDGANGTGAAGSAPRFDPVLDAYLARRSAPGDDRAPGAKSAAAAETGAEGTAQDWAKLRDLFRHARFAGGYKEPHELQDAFRTFRKCLKMTGEDEHE